MHKLFDRSLIIDLLLVAVLGAGSLPSILASGRSWNVVLAITVALLVPIFARRQFPARAMVFVVAVSIVQALLPLPYAGRLLVANLALAVLMYSVVVHGRRRGRWWLLFAAEFLFLVWAVYVGGFAGAVAFVMVTAVMVAAVTTAELNVNRRRQLADAQERALEAEERRDALARTAVVEERARIAREMHDIVAHAVSTMVMQSEGARLLGMRNPAAVDEALRTIGVTGREAVGELRRILGLLRESEADTEPQPGVGALGELVGKVRSAGLETRLVVEGDAEGIPPGAALTAHRIVQEALTNVVKHAPTGARCTVTVGYGTPGESRRTVTIEVVNDGGQGPRVHLAEPGADGYGIRGMRERVSMYGGELIAEPQPDGGFRVAARLPLTMSSEEL
ncbi:sensor histidine kinase [Amycolatopsis sp. NBC_00345]|uniref:sensor histidine kinase n=1 Tax=Amycolatopsis sp. NBC_00345 TaxID=2975955 RepID=UPI002E26C93C